MSQGDVFLLILVAIGGLLAVALFTLCSLLSSIEQALTSMNQRLWEMERKRRQWVVDREVRGMIDHISEE